MTSRKRNLSRTWFVQLCQAYPQALVYVLQSSAGVQMTPRFFRRTVPGVHGFAIDADVSHILSIARDQSIRRFGGASRYPLAFLQADRTIAAGIEIKLRVKSDGDPKPLQWLFPLRRPHYTSPLAAG